MKRDNIPLKEKYALTVTENNQCGSSAPADEQHEVCDRKD